MPEYSSKQAYKVRKSENPKKKILVCQLADPFSLRSIQFLESRKTIPCMCLRAFAKSYQRKIPRHPLLKNLVLSLRGYRSTPEMAYPASAISQASIAEKNIP